MPAEDDTLYHRIRTESPGRERELFLYIFDNLNQNHRRWHNDLISVKSFDAHRATKLELCLLILIKINFKV